VIRAKVNTIKKGMMVSLEVAVVTEVVEAIIMIHRIMEITIIIVIMVIEDQVIIEVEAEEEVIIITKILIRIIKATKMRV